MIKAKLTGLFIRRPTVRVLEALRIAIARGQQGGYAYHVINRVSGRKGTLLASWNNLALKFLLF